MSNKPLQLQSTRDLGPQFTHNPHRMIGQDGAFSIPLPDGQTLWFFGDTLIGKRIPNHSLWVRDRKFVGHADMTGKGPIEHMYNNTGLLLRDKTGIDGLKDFTYLTNPDGSLKTLLPLEGDEHPDWDRIWCQHGIAIDGRIYLSFIKIKTLDVDGPLPVMFEIIGSGLAAGSSKDWKFHRIQQTRPSDGRPFRGAGSVNTSPPNQISPTASSILWPADQPHFATAFLLSSDHAYIYLYGTVKRGDKQLCYLARIAPDRIEQIDQYEYLTSPQPTWDRNIAQAAPLFDGMPSELSVSFNKHLNAFLAVHSLDLTGKIVARTAPNPWGPFSDPIELYQAKATIPKELDYMTLIYAGKEHPELSSDGGRILYLTYIEFEEYFPHLIEVTLK